MKRSTIAALVIACGLLAVGSMPASTAPIGHHHGIEPFAYGSLELGPDGSWWSWRRGVRYRFSHHVITRIPMHRSAAEDALLDARIQRMSDRLAREEVAPEDGDEE